MSSFKGTRFLIKIKFSRSYCAAGTIWHPHLERCDFLPQSPLRNLLSRCQPLDETFSLPVVLTSTSSPQSPKSTAIQQFSITLTSSLTEASFQLILCSECQLWPSASFTTHLRTCVCTHLSYHSEALFFQLRKV